MTQETRIGLLVGLLFIIAFGLVLSELTGTDSLPPAPAAAEEHVEAYAPTPAVEEVALRGDGVLRRPAPAAAGEGVVAVVESSLGGAAGAVERGGAIEAHIGSVPVVLAAVDPPTAGAPRAAGTPAPPAPPAPVALAPPAPPAPRRRVYTVRANDNLIRIARQVYGADGDRFYKRIYEANRRVLPDESTLSIGQELVIPPLKKASSPPSVVEAPGVAREYREMDAGSLRSHFAAPAVRRSERRTYVVQRGDNLTDIARKVLNDSSPEAVRKLFRANRSTLESPDLLQVGMKLNVPS